MKLSQSLFIVFVSTLVAMFYVWQQNEILRLGYVGQKKLSAFYELLDKNSNLRYNLSKNTSLIRIDSKVSGYGSFQIPDSFMVVKTSPSNKDVEPEKLTTVLQRSRQVIANLLSIKQQAEAKTINP